MHRKRVFICEFLQESNSFNPVLATRDDFASSGIYEGNELLQANGSAGETVNGMLKELAERNVEAVGGMRMRAGSGGPVNQSVVDEFVNRNSALLRDALPLDGVLVSLHGATVTPCDDDVCGSVLGIIRQIVGMNVKIAVSFDLHANITTRILKNADFICGYQTYPHLDHYQVGQRAASLLCDCMNGRALYTCCVRLPMMAPAHAYSTGNGKLKTLMERGKALVATNTLVDFSVFQVQPWLDVPEIGSAIVTIAEERDAALEIAHDIAREEFTLRKELQGQALWSIESVVAEAIANGRSKPVVLVDSADSPNAGSCGDCATVLEYLLPYRNILRAAVTVNDAEAVEKAFALGVGTNADFWLGGKLAPLLSEPVAVPGAVVKSLHNGDFLLEGPAERGQLRSLGRSAVLVAGKIQILLTSRSQNAGDLQFYRGVGIEPTLCNLVSVKACASLRAGYEPIAAKICNTQTPGAAASLQTLLFTKIPKVMYPFCEITEQDISAPVLVGAP